MSLSHNRFLPHPTRARQALASDYPWLCLLWNGEDPHPLRARTFPQTYPHVLRQDIDLS
jgi:hypothetical protein